MVFGVIPRIKMSGLAAYTAATDMHNGIRGWSIADILHEPPGDIVTPAKGFVEQAFMRNAADNRKGQSGIPQSQHGRFIIPP